VIGFSLPWYTFPLLIYAAMPWVALAGAFAGGFATYRFTKRDRSVKVLLGALAGSQLVPLLVLLLLGDFGGSGSGGQVTRMIGLGFLVVVAVLSFVVTKLVR
jgi:hypothetical protein